jgi:hypothetical protein
LGHTFHYASRNYWDQTALGIRRPKSRYAVPISAAPVDGIISSESGASRAATTLKRVMSTDPGDNFVTEPGAKW